jgi:hypothetical protein
MTRLRHVNARTLVEAEAMLELVKEPLIVVNVSNVSGSWFIHFLLQGVNKDIKVGVVQKTIQTKNLIKEKK